MQHLPGWPGLTPSQKQPQPRACWGHVPGGRGAQPLAALKPASRWALHKVTALSAWDGCSRQSNALTASCPDALEH